MLSERAINYREFLLKIKALGSIRFRRPITLSPYGLSNSGCEMRELSTTKIGARVYCDVCGRSGSYAKGLWSSRSDGLLQRRLLRLPGTDASAGITVAG